MPKNRYIKELFQLKQEFAKIILNILKNTTLVKGDTHAW